MKSKIIVAMVCITALLITALILGYNGVLLATGVTIIAGLAGWSAHKVKKS